MGEERHRANPRWPGSARIAKKLMNTKIIFLICILVVSLSLSIWLLLRPKTESVTIPAVAEAGDIFLKPCPVKIASMTYQADCGALIVPENRSHPVSRLIALPVKRIHSRSDHPQEPIFYLAGGPGQSNMGFQPPAWLLEQHDVVMVGYRGVDGEPKLDCPEVSTAMLGVDGDLLSPASLDNLSAAMQTCAKRLQDSGVDLAGYTIPEVVEDMESARSGLGYSRINLLSESYGTRVAQIYAIMHSESLLRSAMLGVNPPGHFLWLPATTDTQVETYARLCQKDDNCTTRIPNLAASMRSVNQSMPKHWLFLPIDPGKVKVVAFAMLFHRTTAPIIFDAYLAAERGDPSGLALMSLAYDFMMPKMMTWGEFFAIGSSADFEAGRDYRAELSTPDAILGAPMSMLIWGSAAGWPVTPMPEQYRQVHPSDIPTLLVSGSVDFSTPAEFATQELLPSLRNGKQVLLSEQGHVGDFWGFQTEAAEHLLTSFFTTGEADDSLYTYLPMDFKPVMSFPLLAKILLVTGILLLIALGWAVWAMTRRIRRGRR
jgi:pimeloyl-ACP methyl ester carboxylesterase